MYRWQPLLLMVLVMMLALSRTAIVAQAQIQIPGFVQKGLVVTYTGTARATNDKINKPAGQEPSSQMIKVKTADQSTVEGFTEITYYCDPTVNGQLLCQPPQQYTTPKLNWSCSLNSA